MTTITEVFKSNPNKINLELEDPNINYNVPMAKTITLITWVLENVVKKTDNYISMNTLYEQYKSDCTSPMAQSTFFKEIDAILLAFKYEQARIRIKEGRGYIGISLKMVDSGKYSIDSIETGGLLNG